MVADRWIKFEEDVEEGGERWSKPRVATLSLHSLFELRKGILTGTVLLDMTAVTIYQMFGMQLNSLLIQSGVRKSIILAGVADECNHRNNTSISQGLVYQNRPVFIG